MPKKPPKSERHRKAALAGVEKRKMEGTWIAHQKYARSKLPHEAVMRGAKKGAAKVVSKYGENALIKFAREWRLKNPSEPERRLLEILTGLGYTETTRNEYGEPNADGSMVFIREDPCGSYLLDVYFPTYRCAIEVDGKPPEWMDDQRLDFELRRIRNIESRGIALMQIRAESLVGPRVVEEIEAFLWLRRGQAQIPPLEEPHSNAVVGNPVVVGADDEDDYPF